MNKAELEIKNTIGQLEASLSVAAKYIDELKYPEYCDQVYSAIAKLHAASRRHSDNQYLNM